VHFRLPAEVEHLLLVGGADLQGYGNALANNLVSNDGVCLLSGGDGDDTSSSAMPTTPCWRMPTRAST
jgi:serralysin